jgi:hypothetical protein
MKGLRGQVTGSVRSLSEFNAGEHRKCQQYFGTAAVLFAIIAEYDGPIRWKQHAAGMRDAFGRAGYACKVASDQSYREAKLRAENLNALVRGERPPVAEGAADADWSRVAELPPLMRRMELALEDRLRRALDDARDGDGGFGPRKAVIVHEAQIVAALAEVIQQEGFELADDEQYRGQARRLRQVALQMAQAADNGRLVEARAASQAVAQACNQCHDAFR